MRLSNLADYAVVLMSAAARHCGAARLAEGKLNATKLSQETGVPLPTAKKLVSRLTAAGLFESTRGIGGGIRFRIQRYCFDFLFAVDRDECSLAVIIAQ